jgi:hypothetical protein
VGAFVYYAARKGMKIARNSKLKYVYTPCDKEDWWQIT